PSIGTPAPVPREEVMYAIGNVLARGEASREAGKDLLDEALKLNGQRPETLAAIGSFMDRAKPGSGDAMFEKGVSIGTAKAIVYRQYGRALIDRQKEIPDPALAKRAREVFAKAVELNPKVADAQVGLGMTYLMLPGDPKPGIAALEKGLELDPQNTSAAMNLVALLVRSGDRDGANAVIDKDIAPYADAPMLRQARELLEKK
ncbi:MAG TPA: hypothetical protein VF381_04600, partial [Thermoanaerobaculia bacterium]